MNEAVLEYLHEQDRRPFAWGSVDCTHFCGSWWERVTGHNPLTAYSYAMQREALRLIAEAGSLRALVTREIGEPQRVTKSGTEIQAGDIVLATYAEMGEILGIALPPCGWYRRENGRLAPAPLEQCLCFWRP